MLAALYEQPTLWQDGSALAMQTDYRRSGLTQIARQGKTQRGQPVGERYRLTADGLASAAIALAAAAQPAGWLAARRL